MAGSGFQILDYILFVGMLAVSIGIGLFHAFRGGRQRTTNEFLMGNRNLKVIPVAVSILVSFLSAIMILGVPAEMYNNGIEYYLSVGGLALGCSMATLLFVPLLYPLRLTSSYEYLEQRFKSKIAKQVGVGVMIVQQILYMGIASFAPSIALEAVTGFPVSATIVIVGAVATVYTFLGGMKAVIWADFFQSFIMIAGILAIVIQGNIRVGGFGKMWQINKDWGRINLFHANSFNVDPRQRHAAWQLVIGTAVNWTATFGLNQSSVQRYCALPTLNKARICIIMNIFGGLFFVTLTCLAGISTFAYFADKGCDPMTGKSRTPTSSVSSSLNALSAVSWESILKPHLAHRISEKNHAWVTRATVVLFGAAGVGMAFLARGLGGTVLQAAITFNGAANGPILGIFFLGAVFPFANWIGASVGTVSGLTFVLWIGIGSYSLRGHRQTLAMPIETCQSSWNVSDAIISSLPATTVVTSTAAVPEAIEGLGQLYSISYLWYTSIGFATTVLVGLIVSVLTGPTKPSEVDPKYTIPIFDRLCCCIPGSIRQRLRCGIDEHSPEDFNTDKVADEEIKKQLANSNEAYGNDGYISDDKI